MKVYRVQNEEGKGPYRKLRWLTESHNSDWIKYPTPIQDGIPFEEYKKDGWVCGFESMEQLREWFSEEELQDMKKDGFFVVELEAERAVFGNKQLIFWEKDNESNSV